jgi:hypothetical protein
LVSRELRRRTRTSPEEESARLWPLSQPRVKRS